MSIEAQAKDATLCRKQSAQKTAVFNRCYASKRH
jgi:hypothetical protein